MSFSSYWLRSFNCRDIKTLKIIHGKFIVSNNYHKPISIQPMFITLYTHFQDLESSILVFQSIREPNTVSWNSIIKSHIQFGYGDSAISLYRQMRNFNIQHDDFTLPILNQSALSIHNGLSFLNALLSLSIRLGLGSELYFCNTMIALYVKCGDFSYARQLFDEMPDRDVVSWTSIISCCNYEGNIDIAFKLFKEMNIVFKPTSITMVVMFDSCCSLYQGKQLHCYVIKIGFPIEESLQNSILKMYTDNGQQDEAENFFEEIPMKDYVSWNIMIMHAAKKGNFMNAVELFKRMRFKLGLKTETLTIMISNNINLLHGGMIHCLSIKYGLDGDYVFRTSLLDFYAKFGELKNSTRVLTEMPFKNEVTCNAMMSAFVKCGAYDEAIRLFNRVIHYSDINPTALIFTTLISAYSHIGALRLGKVLHGYLIRTLLYNNQNTSHLETSILNMYLNCGSISYAKACFEKIVTKDIVTWTTMIDGYGIHGLGVEALQLFDRMLKEEEGIMTRSGTSISISITFLSLLSACSHSGLLNEGFRVFNLMKWEFGIEPDLDHYTCVVDMLSRAGNLKEAICMILKRVVLPDGRIWGALLAGARVYGSEEVFGEYVASRVLELEPDNVGYYTLVSNMEAKVEKWGEVEEIRKCMRNKDLVKKPGCSYVEAGGSIHGFVSGDRSHSKTFQIYELLGGLTGQNSGI
ncbi:pentatricopeptide repeat-containing protein DOT4, chloroplastic-like [Impatiens glandulifera]|uniref:pentatricopeptide repeat-containing protein DOT4, chloroplastic-like n=1 Tax=Impatiens glandulifera TaxID=253017 RepID=UPI001FB17D67|nr:pentatricopeptide repeat-containing protein DOT4, chloroplastic-like [Impatiens glandulifera]